MAMRLAGSARPGLPGTMENAIKFYRGDASDGVPPAVWGVPWKIKVLRARTLRDVHHHGNAVCPVSLTWLAYWIAHTEQFTDV